MARSPRQKLKLLFLMRMLLERSDERHPLSMEEIIAGLEANDISAERKSLYNDIEALRLFGMDVRMTKAKPGGYFVANRDFELPELKLLVDSVQSSRFITEKKTLQLIRKLEGLCSVHEARLLRGQVYVSGRIKHMNESIYYSVDAIHTAIAADKKICFQYFDYTVDKKKVYRHGAKRYLISPFALNWDDENYYMIGFDAEAGKLKHYRVDRMEKLMLADAEREGHDAFQAHDMGVYANRTFGMYGGRELCVDMEFENRLAGLVIDRFGKDAVLNKREDGYFSVSVPVMISPQFYAWVFGLGPAARITGPEEAVRGMREQLESVVREYR